jgi:hypothetical protein
MRTLLFVVTALASVAPAFDASAQEQSTRIAREDDDQPRGDRWEDRWRGRQHILYDDIRRPDTDGYSSNAAADCRTFILRYKRPDGTTGIRRENRCK